MMTLLWSVNLKVLLLGGGASPGGSLNTTGCAVHVLGECQHQVSCLHQSEQRLWEFCGVGDGEGGRRECRAAKSCWDFPSSLAKIVRPASSHISFVSFFNSDLLLGGDWSVTASVAGNGEREKGPAAALGRYMPLLHTPGSPSWDRRHSQSQGPVPPLWQPGSQVSLFEPGNVSNGAEGMKWDKGQFVSCPSPAWSPHPSTGSVANVKNEACRRGSATASGTRRFKCPVPSSCLSTGSGERLWLLTGIQ